jgi:serpin B
MQAVTAVCLVLMAAAPATNPKKIAKANNAFAFDLYHEITKTEEGNVFFSPFSISTALAMTYAGADSTTADEMQKAMHFGSNTEEFHASYGAYLRQLNENADGNIQLRIANRLWGEQSYALKKSFLDMNMQAYNSPLMQVDFMYQPDASRKEINNWVADKTEQRIKDLLPEASITTDTRLVLTNAIYFKGDWLYKFDKKKTKEQTFYLADGTTKKTPFMNFEGAFNFYGNGEYKMIQLPYKGEKHSMVVVLPNDPEKLDAIEKTFSAEDFAPLDYQYKPEVILSLPKFKITIPLGLNGPLQNLGIKTAFTSHADFSNMTEQNNFMISDVFHKAFIEIDEEGTEAAAATAVVVVQTSSIAKPPKPEEFIADHPFLFYIIDNETMAILFMGRIMEPIIE